MTVSMVPGADVGVSATGWQDAGGADREWFVLHTKSRQEKALAKSLDAIGVVYFLPMVTKACFHGKRKLTVDAPLFPSYVFLRGELDDAYTADRTKRIARVIRVADQERMDRELWNIYLALIHQAPLDPYPYLKKGIWVEVRSGPFQGMQGIIEDRWKHDRIILQVETLGRALSVEVDGALLEPLD